MKNYYTYFVLIDNLVHIVNNTSWIITPLFTSFLSNNFDVINLAAAEKIYIYQIVIDIDFSNNVFLKKIFWQLSYVNC